MIGLAKIELVPIGLPNVSLEGFALMGAEEDGHIHDYVGNWLWDDGTCILWDDGDVMSF